MKIDLISKAVLMVVVSSLLVTLFFYKYTKNIKAKTIQAESEQAIWRRNAPANALLKPFVDGHITGTVTDDNGNPLSEIHVELYQYYYFTDEWYTVASGDTNSDGTYDIGSLNPGSYRVGFFGWHYGYISEYYDNAPNIKSATDVEVTDDATTKGIDASLSMGGHITGTVTDRDGNALSGISVYVYQYFPESGYWYSYGYGNSNSDGTYDVDGLNTGTYRVGFFDYNTDNYISEYYDNAPDLGSATDVSVTIGETTSGIDASLGIGGHITGTVTDRDGNALSNIEVHVYQYNPELIRVAYGYTNGDGTYDVGSLNTGTYRVSFSDNDYHYMPEYYDNAPDLESATDVSVTVGETTSHIDASLSTGGHITGTVTDRDGNGLPSIEVHVYQYSSEGGYGGYVAYGYTNSDGRYDVARLNTGTYRVGFSDNNYHYMPEYYDNAPDLESATDVSVTVGETTSHIDASLSTGGHITGTVTDREGNALYQISVGVYQYSSEWDSWASVASGYTNSDGTYDVGTLNTGTYRVGFSDDYYDDYMPEYYDNAPDLERADDVSVTVDETTSGIDASLSSGGHITGTVTDREGNALYQISVGVYQYSSEWDSWASVASGYTNSDGMYEIGRLNTGTYRVHFFDDFYHNYIPEYYDNAPDLERATDVEVTVGENRNKIDASLEEKKKSFLPFIKK